ncbi:MAG: transposase [Flavobacteriales bacterium]|nr:transposase [Flavobacteriales bacterium]
MDGLNGFSEAIQGVFTRAVVQRCIVHMVRTSLKFVSWKDYKTVCQGLRSIHQQDSPEAAWEKLQEFKREWVGRYPEIAAKWEKDWCELSPFFDHPDAIRRGDLHHEPGGGPAPHSSQGHQDQGAFISESALEKQLYLTLKHNEKSWKRKVRSWPQILQSLSNMYPERLAHVLVQDCTETFSFGLGPGECHRASVQIDTHFGILPEDRIFALFFHTALLPFIS